MGLQCKKVGKKTFEVARKRVDKLVGVDEGLISETLIDMYSKQELLLSLQELLQSQLLK